MKNTLFASCALAAIFALAAPALAQNTMPPPRAMPRTPVSRQELQAEAAAPRMVQGPAVVFDGEKLRVADTDLRLFGIVPPQLGASYGPQARATLDALANGQTVSCQVRDRDREFRLLATCRSAAGADMALELLRRGLAVTARGSLAGSDLANAYLSAEQSAQMQKLGIWSAAAPIPAGQATTAANAMAAPAARVETSTALPATAAAAHDDKTSPRSDKANTADAATPAALPPPSEAQAKIAADIIKQQAKADKAEDAEAGPGLDADFFQRYQILIASILMLATALSIIAAVWAQKRRDKRDEAKSVAAALRGELMAARGVCIGRIKSITNELEDHAAVWPRIRSTLYQAYVGRLGLLGAELSRQIASIYGQSSDYTALYNPNGAAHEAPKKHALETLVRHIDEVLPRLAGIEHRGVAPNPAALYYQRPRSRYDAPALPRAAQPALQANYKTIAPPPAAAEQRKPAPAMAGSTVEPMQAYEDAAARAAQLRQAAADAQAKPAALWEAVRGFIQNHRNAIAQAPYDEHVSEYAEMIEADMARYPYSDSIESLDISPYKKRG